MGFLFAHRSRHCEEQKRFCEWLATWQSPEDIGAVDSSSLLCICSGYTLQATLACAEADEGQAFHYYPAARKQ
jgi:hypothetical protein